jgi:hypothetical protein
MLLDGTVQDLPLRQDGQTLGMTLPAQEVYAIRFGE